MRSKRRASVFHYLLPPPLPTTTTATMLEAKLNEAAILKRLLDCMLSFFALYSPLTIMQLSRSLSQMPTLSVTKRESCVLPPLLTLSLSTLSSRILPITYLFDWPARVLEHPAPRPVFPTTLSHPSLLPAPTSCAALFVYLSPILRYLLTSERVWACRSFKQWITLMSHSLPSNSVQMASGDTGSSRLLFFTHLSFFGFLLS